MAARSGLFGVFGLLRRREFLQSVEGDRLLTSVAQVFNERGEGVIVQGGNARVEKDDPTPHLLADDMAKLLVNAINIYRRVHRTSPARIVVHKTSHFNDAEIEGARSAADEHRIDLIELIGIRRSWTRLFRSGTLPPLRGTYLELDDTAGIIYLRGSVPHLRTYPGMYVPRPFEFRRDYGSESALVAAREVLELSKLNFNNTQFDGGEPVTVRAARRVGDILKNVEPGRLVQSRFRYFT